MIYKIGRYHYKEISEDEWYDIMIEETKDVLFTLMDYDGEPIKFLRRVKNKIAQLEKDKTELRRIEKEAEDAVKTIIHGKVFKDSNINKEVKNGKKS